MSAELFKEMAQSILDGDDEVSVELAEKGLAEGLDPLQIITDGYMPGVNEVGDAFACGDAFLPELVMAGEAMKAAIAVLEPAMKASGQSREILGKVVLATVEGDIHEIGKSLVGTMLTSSGFEVYDMGVDVPADVLLAKAEEVDADIIGLSALLTTTMIKQKELIDEVAKRGMKVMVMVGGAPVTKEWVQRIEADGYSEDAIGAVAIAKELMASKQRS